MAKFNNENKRFSSLPNALIDDNTIPMESRFIYVYMNARPEGWEFFHEPMAKALMISVDTLTKYMDILIERGWLVKGRQKNVNGKFGACEYTLKAVRKKPSGKNTDTENFRNGKLPQQDINSSINTPLNTDNSTINSPVKENKEKDAYASKSTRTDEELSYEKKMKEQFPRIMRMEQPLTLEQAKNLKKRYDSDLLMKIMQEMENWKPLTKKNVSAYKTIINWCDRENERA